MWHVVENEPEAILTRGTDYHGPIWGHRNPSRTAGVVSVAFKSLFRPSVFFFPPRGRLELEKWPPAGRHFLSL